MGKVFRSDARCPVCGEYWRYESNGHCAICSRSRSKAYRDASRRRFYGLPPTKADQILAQERILRQTEGHLRQTAKIMGAKQFQGVRTCKRGHVRPMRYVSTGGCVRCGLRSSRLQYAKRKG